MIKKYRKLSENQTGAVSMIVAILIMLLITLIVLAMSQNADNEQRQSLDRQLSDQAFYNAESGINDVMNFLYEDPNAAIEYKHNCGLKNTQPLYFDNGDIDGTSGVNKHTCLLYDKAPTTLVYDDVGTANSRVIPIDPIKSDGVTPDTLTVLKITWDDAGDQNDNVSGCDNIFHDPTDTVIFPKTLPADCIGGVRVDLIPLNAADRTNVIMNTRNAFLLPGGNLMTNGNNLSFDSSGYPKNQGAIGIARCDPGLIKRKCGILLKRNMPPTPFILHIKGLYRAVDVNIEGRNDVNFSAVKLTDEGTVRFRNAQVMIDSTGRANDVLRRIQVRVPAKPQFRHGEFAIQSANSLCKILNVGQTTVVSDDPNKCPLDP